ncbi:MAG: ABC transporter permease, partial [Dehalococcoidales bacterium]|nr:ABC transporter permease [Dehalococcoidales bacterium]
MRDYLIRRILLLVPTLLMVTMIVFFLVRFIPGDVIDLMVREMAEEARAGGMEFTAQVLREQLGLDLPIHVQYGRWLGNAIRGDLGTSLWTQRPIVEDILRRIPVSFELAFLALIIKLLISIPIGVWSAIRQDTMSDYVGRTIAIVFISAPSFWVATMIIVYPSIWWGWSPALEYIPITKDVMGNLVQFIIPASIMGMLATGTTMRMTRTMMLEVLRQDYIRTAWAKGLNERTIIMRHALKNAMIPVITVIGLSLPVLIGGSVVLENIFVLPGIGRLLVEAINQRDYPVISGINIFVASFILVANLLVDL